MTPPNSPSVISPPNGNGGVPARLTLGDSAEAWILRAIQKRGRASYSEIAEETGLSRSVISTTVTALEDQKIVKKGEARSASGRPPVAVTLEPRVGVLFGLDLGHNRARVAVANARGDSKLGEPPREVEWAGEAWQWDFYWDDLDKGMARAIELLELARKKAGIEDTSEIVGVGVGIPAPVDADGTVMALQGPWTGRRPAAELAKRLRWKTEFVPDNDTNLEALGEFRFGALRNASNAIHVHLSTGIGGALVVDGELRRGHEHLAGELGHVPVPGLRNGTSGSCPRCGQENCLEMVAGGRAIVAEVNARLGKERHRELSSVLEAAREELRSEPGPHLEVVSAAAEHVGAAMAPIVSALAPEVLVIGGRFGADDYGLVAGPVYRGLDRYAMPAAAERVQLETGQLRPGEAGALGGIALAYDRLMPAFLERLLHESR